MLKRKMILLTLLFLITMSIIPIPSRAATQATYYVWPSGSDSNPGTLSQPFATIGKARDAIRTINSNMTGDIIVYLRGGTYTLADTFELNQSDSGTNGYNIIYQNYPGEKPVISGGAEIAGWSVYDSSNTIYKANVPSSFDTRQLYVNGLRAVRAKGGENLQNWTGYTSAGYTSNGYSSNTNTVYVTVDLGSSQTVGYVKLHPYISSKAVGGGNPGFPVDFTIQVSTDGINYSVVKTITNQGNPNSVAPGYSFTPVTARYVRVNVTKLGIPQESETSIYRLQLAEVEIYSSDNLALNKTVTSNSSVEVAPSVGAANLTDGTDYYYSSYSYTSDNFTFNVTVDLGTNQTISVVKLTPRNYWTMEGDSPNFPVNFSIQTSTDGVNFSTVKTVTGQSNPNRAPQEYSIPPTNTRYIKVNATKLGIPAFEDGENRAYRLQLGEMEVYSSGNLALSKTVTSNNSVEISSLGVAKLTDGYSNLSNIGYITTDSNMANWKNISNIELVIYKYGWMMYRCGIDSISSTKITMKQPGFTSVGGLTGYTTIKWIENAYELLDAPGEWYLDKTGQVDGTGIPKIYYKPRYGENMQTAKIVAPNLQTLVKGTGTLGSTVHNIQFTGLSFQYSTWLEPNNNNGYNDKQAGFRGVGIKTEGHYWKKMPSAVSFYGSKSIKFERNIFTYLGGAALNIEYGSQDNTVIGNRFEDLAGGGIFIGDVRDHHPSDSRAIVKNNTVSNNLFTNTGAEYYDTVAIWAGYTENTLIEHNEIYNTPYTGINVGWGWGYADAGGDYGYATPTVAQNNHVQYNLINYVLQERKDGGAIYTLGSQPDSTINNNYINYVSDITLGDTGGAIYPDEGSRKFSIQYNVISNAYKWLSMWTSSIQNNTARYNYSDTSNYRNDGLNNTVSDNTTISNGNWPTEARNIMNSAGIQSTYQDIRSGSSENLALFQFSNTNSSQEVSGWSVTNLTDGLRNSMYTSGSFSSNQNTVNTITDLGTSKTVGSVKLYPRPIDSNGNSPGFPVDFTIQASMDGINYSTVKSVAGQPNPQGLVREYAFSPVTARYIKLNVTCLGVPAADEPTNYRFQLGEIEIYSKANLAWGKSVTALNSQESSPWGAAKLTDGATSYMSGSAGYTSNQYDSQNSTAYVAVDLGSSQPVSTVILYPRASGTSVDGDSPSFPEDFTIQISNDGTNYSTVKTVTGQANPNGVPQTYTFTATNTRYIKLNVTKLGKAVADDPSHYRLQLTEMEICP